MKISRLMAAFVVAIGLFTSHTVLAHADPTGVRVFLKDGVSLVSYGEFARVNDRVVFSMPTSASVNDPQLQLVSLSADHVDWDRPTSYAGAARSARYIV